MKKVYRYNGSLITANSKQEAIQVLASKNKLNISIDYKTAKELSDYFSRMLTLPGSEAEKLHNKINKFILEHDGDSIEDRFSEVTKIVKQEIKRVDNKLLKDIQKKKLQDGKRVYVFKDSRNFGSLCIVGVDTAGNFIGSISNNKFSGEEIATKNIEKFKNFVKKWVEWLSLSNEKRGKLINKNTNELFL